MNLLYSFYKKKMILCCSMKYGGIKMEEHLDNLLKIKENELIKAFEMNNMSCLIVKDQKELETYFINPHIVVINIVNINTISNLILQKLCSFLILKNI